MARYTARRCIVILSALMLIGLMSTGCEKDPGAAQAIPATSGQTASSNSASANVQADTRLTQSFQEATRQEPPTDGDRPPDLTLTGKSVGKLYTEVQKAWSNIPFVTPEGKNIQYKANLETELGPIEISLRPELAPNHVRNFIALAQIGYYDGLVFERTVHAKPTDKPEQEVEVLEGGCPLGSGDSGTAGLGYWLKPEFSKEEHEIGTVGAYRGMEDDSACCRFYITLSKAPFLDGHFTVFGKITHGIDTARRIFALPVRNDPEYPEGDRPEKPVMIKKVTITSSVE